MSKKKNDYKENGILFNIPFEGEPDKELDLMAYAFDRRGRLLTSAPFKVTAERVRLPLSDAQARNARIFFGPMPAEERPQEAITLETMEKWQAYEAIWRFNPDQREYHLQPVPELQWRWWPWCNCRVRGQVVRPVNIGGLTYNKPVCHARVHICEVDYIFWTIKKLPELEIWRLRDDLLHLIEEPIPFPWPPQPDPPPFDLALERGSMFNRFGSEVAFNPQPDPPSEMAAMSAESLTNMVSNQVSNLPLSIRANLSSNSNTVVRQALLDNIHLIIPYLCWLEWFWPFVRCDEVAIVETDENGRFDTNFWYLCFGDKPDLYFWVEYSIGGTWTTVYHPPIRCNTYWNYQCGQEVTIRVTDPRVNWCEPAPRVPGNHLAILGIGENVGFQQIYGPTTGSQRGLTISGGGTIGGSPFGAVLEPRVYFGEDLVGNGISHYRWSYRKVADSNNSPVSDSWHAMDRQVFRHYSYVSGDGTLKFKPYFLGPDTDPALSVNGLNLFQIQPEDPPVGLWAPQVNAHENTASAHFETASLDSGNVQQAAGKYEMKLEVFNTAGNRIPFQDGATTNVQPVVAVGNAPFGDNGIDLDTDPAPAANLIVESGKVVAFRMIVHVDNNPCEAVIHPVKIGGVEADMCGFLNYDSTADLVNLSFKARHENDFATFGFNVYRGKVGSVESADGKVGLPQDGYAESNGEYAKDVTVSHLMRPLTSGGTPCVRAAFAETLDVDAMATNGWNRLSGLDLSALPLAFALAPSSD